MSWSASASASALSSEPSSCSPSEEADESDALIWSPCLRSKALPFPAFCARECHLLPVPLPPILRRGEAFGEEGVSDTKTRAMQSPS